MREQMGSLEINLLNSLANKRSENTEFKILKGFL
jgi:hypothetical protein